MMGSLRLTGLGPPHSSWLLSEFVVKCAHNLRDRLMVGHEPLKLVILVRIQVPQQIFKSLN